MWAGVAFVVLFLLSVWFQIVSECHRGTDMEPQKPWDEQQEWHYWWISEVCFVGALGCLIVALMNK